MRTRSCSPFLLALAITFLITSCQDTKPIDSSRHFTPGLTITLPQPPTPGLVNLFEDCHARRVSEKVFVIEAYDRHDENQGYAIHQALVEGATMTGWRSPP